MTRSKLKEVVEKGVVCVLEFLFILGSRISFQVIHREGSHERLWPGFAS